jgi:hypothetical protein
MATTYIDVTMAIDAPKLKRLESNLTRVYGAWRITVVQIAHEKKHVWFKLALSVAWDSDDSAFMEQLYQEGVLDEPHKLCLCSEHTPKEAMFTTRQMAMTVELLAALKGLVGEYGYVEDEWCYCVSDDVCSICQARNTYNVYCWAWKYLA